MPETNPFQDDPRLDEAWQSYTHDAEGSPMMDPNEVRRHGDRRRRRRAATGLAGIAAAAVLAVGVIFAVTAFDNQTPEFAGTPSPNPTQGPSEEPTGQPTDEPTDAPSDAPGETETPGLPSDDDQLDQYLPSGQEIFFETPGDLGEPTIYDGLVTGTEADRYLICEYDENIPADEQETLANYPGTVGARTAIYSDGQMSFRAHVIQLDSADRATELAGTISRWAEECNTRVTGWNGEAAEGYNDPSQDFDQVRVDFNIQKQRVSEDESNWQGVLILTYEDRVLIVVDHVVGNDYNSVGPVLHAEQPDLPLIPTARELDSMVERMKS